jgi:hypothetical protein
MLIRRRPGSRRIAGLVCEKKTSLVVLQEILCEGGYSFSMETLVAFTKP